MSLQQRIKKPHLPSQQSVFAGYHINQNASYYEQKQPDFQGKKEKKKKTRNALEMGRRQVHFNLVIILQIRREES